MTGTILSILAGLVVVFAVTVLTGYFVAQEFGFVTADRSRLRAMADAGDGAARRALSVTERTSFLLSGAQLGITVTGLVVGYVAEPMIGRGVAELLGVTGLPRGLLAAFGAAFALAVATVVQMVFGELFPKNLAIARPEPVARRLALSTSVYLTVFGGVIRLFDGAANRLLRTLGIEPVHDIDEAATAGDLGAIIDESRDSGQIPPDLSLLLDRVLDFTERTARTAMIPRPEVATVPMSEPFADLVRRMGQAHSRYPVVGDGPDDVRGVVHLRDVLTLPADEAGGATAGSLARPALFVPDTLVLPELLGLLRAQDQQLACVVDEFGGLAGIVTIEDVAEELVGEIIDEHDVHDDRPTRDDRGWTVAGSLSIEETERLVGRDLPHGHFSTVGGLVVDELGRLPVGGDVLDLDLTDPLHPLQQDSDGGQPRPRTILSVRVLSVRRRVPGRVRLEWRDVDEPPAAPR